ncbi:outer membrane autotransporter barrel domain-containing protein [Escherichia coli]|nr:outer membrane autotransporter barrel domain-containing protein [Escherichia coli]
MNSEGGKPGNVLTVNGNYTGNNGLMTFNATLGGDNSPTDKMNVKGDTQGNTRVRVDNIGGVGAQTVNGIELIEVGGNSAGNFALTTGTVEAGAYVYTLAKGKGNDEKNWYLTSKWDGVTPPDTPDPINNPPVVDPEGPSVYRPEAGSYISNIAAANSLFSHRLHDRLGEPQYIDSLHSQGSASSMWMRHVGGHERSRAGDGQLNTQANQREFQPYIEANWINNSKVYAVKMNGQTVGREGARNLGEVRTGVEAKVNNNLSLWGNVGVQLGDKGYSDTQGMLGVKYSW